MQPTPLPPLNNPTPEQAFLAKNYDENARRADRDPRGIFLTPTDASAAPPTGLVGPLGSSSFSLPTVERAMAEMEGSGGTGASLGGLSLGRRADIAYPRECAGPDAARGAAEFLQEPAESQGPRGEPWDLGGEPWCGTWKAPGDRAEDVGRWCWC